MNQEKFSGSREQVLEVIVRQALAGAEWRQNCAGPMQENNISLEEVEAEVERRRVTGGPNVPKQNFILPIAFTIIVTAIAFAVSKFQH